MRLILWLAVLAACEKSGPVESSESTPSTPRETEAAKPAPPKVVGTLPNDAGVVAAPAPVADAAVAAAKPDASDRDRQMVDDAKAMANLLTSGGTASQGDMSARRRPGADLGKQIQDVRDSGANVAVGGGTGGKSRGTGDPRVGTGKGARIDGPDDRVGADAVGSTPKGRISVAGKQAFDESSLTTDAVLAKIQSAYMAGIKRCYKNHLKNDPNAKGKLSIRFTVNEAGRTISGKAVGFAKPIDDCLAEQIVNWRFPIPKDKDGEPTEASFDFKLNLVPD